MKRVEVKLSLPVVAPLLDVIKGVVDRLEFRLAAPAGPEAIDPELREGWQEELLAAQSEDSRTLLGLFDREFFASGVIGFDERNAEAIVRACSAVRLFLREADLKTLPDEVLESGNVAMEELPDATRKAFMGYLFLATIQELIIQHLDSSIIDG